MMPSTGLFESLTKSVIIFNRPLLSLLHSRARSRFDCDFLTTILTAWSPFFLYWVEFERRAASRLHSPMMDSFLVSCKNRVRESWVWERMSERQAELGMDKCGILSHSKINCQQKSNFSTLSQYFVFDVVCLLSRVHSTSMNVNWQEFVQRNCFTCMLSHVNFTDYCSLSTRSCHSPLNCWNFPKNYSNFKFDFIHTFWHHQEEEWLDEWVEDKERVENWGMKNSNYDFIHSHLGFTSSSSRTVYMEIEMENPNEMTIWFHSETIFIRIKSLGRGEDDTIEICLAIERTKSSHSAVGEEESEKQKKRREKAIVANEKQFQ